MKRRKNGFTLIELMVVITILGLLAGITSVALMPRLREARIENSKHRMHNIVSAVDIFHARKGRLPESIQELIDTEYLDGKEEPVDAWGNTYQYRKIGRRNYELFCYGADGQEGGEGDDADITRDDLSKQPEAEK